MPTDNFGERAATEDEVDDWVTMVKNGRRATRGYRAREGQVDHMRPQYGSGDASSESGED